MKRYLLFIGSYYYPSGGMEDYVNDFENLELAKKGIISKIKEEYEEFYPYEIEDLYNEYRESFFKDYWAHIYDTKTREIVFKTNLETVL